MSARTAAVVFGLGLSISVAAWLLAQLTLSASAGRDLADVAVQGARVLPLAQLLAAGLVVPWLYAASPGFAVWRPLLLFVAIPLPLQTLIALAAPLPSGAVLAGLGSVVAWSLLAAAATAALHHRRTRRGAPIGSTVLQASAVALVWRAGNDWIDWIGLS